MEVRETLYMHEIELPDDSHRKKIEHVKQSILAMKERTKILRDTIVQRDVELTVLRVYVPSQRLGCLVLKNSWIP